MKKIKLIICTLLLINAQTNLFATELHEACREGNLEQVKAILEKSTEELDKKDSDFGNTPLHTAIENNNDEIATYLLDEYDISIKIKNNDGNTALHLAVLKKNVKIVKQIVKEYEFDYAITNDMNNTVFTLACQYEYYDIAKSIFNEIEEEGKKEIIRNACKEEKNATLITLIKHCYFSASSLLNFICKHNDIETIIQIEEKLKELEVDLLKILFDACRNGKLEIVKHFIDTLEYDIESQDKEKNTLLHIACDNNNIKIIEYLLQKEANPDTVNKKRQKPLHKAIERNNKPIVILLLNKRKDLLYTWDEKEYYPIHCACCSCKQCDFPMAKLLIETYGASINILSKTIYAPDSMSINISKKTRFTPLEIAIGEHGKDTYRESSYRYYPKELTIVDYLEETRKKQIQNLCFACKKGDLKTVQHHIEEFGYSVNSKDKKNNTLLHIACEKNYFEIVKYLIQQKANPNTYNTYCNTPLHIACEKNYFEIVNCLVKQKANPNTRNTDDNTPLHIACKNDHFEIVDCLVKQKKINLNARDAEGNTPFAIACLCCETLEIPKYLVENGAVISTVNNAGDSPLAIACDTRDGELVNYLLEKKAKLKTINKEGNTPFAIACGRGCKNIAKNLLQEKANPFSCNKAGNSCLGLAAANKHKNVVRVILEDNPELVDKNDDHGFNTLHYASWAGDLPMTKLLVTEFKAYISALSKCKKTPIILAENEDHTNVVEFLKKAALEQETKTKIII